MKMKSENSLTWIKLSFHFEQKIELANATLTSSFALHPAMFKKLKKKIFVFFLLAVHLATFKKFSFFFMYLGFFSRQIYLFI